MGYNEHYTEIFCNDLKYSSVLIFGSFQIVNEILKVQQNPVVKPKSLHL